MSKGKVCRRYEFGNKVNIVTTIEEGFVLGMRAIPGNPYDGHTLSEAWEQFEILVNQPPKFAVVDRGYRGLGMETTQVLIPWSEWGRTLALMNLLQWRSANELEIGHMESDGRLERCPRNGLRGDAILAVLCSSGHNLRKSL